MDLLIGFQSQLETDREIFHPLDHSPNDCNGQCWAKLKSGVKNFWFSHVRVEGRGPNSWAIFCCCLPQIINMELTVTWSRWKLNLTYRRYQSHRRSQQQLPLPLPFPAAETYFTFSALENSRQNFPTDVVNHSNCFHLEGHRLQRPLYTHWYPLTDHLSRVLWEYAAGIVNPFSQKLRIRNGITEHLIKDA